MSAFIVDKAHIDALVTLAIKGPSDASKRHWYHVSWYHDANNGFPREATFTAADDIGQMLVDENVRSIQYRYPDTIEHPEDAPGPCDNYYLEPYVWAGFWNSKSPTAVAGLKAVACYEYQACEHPEWKESEAHAFCEALRSWLIDALPGYDDASWVITQPVEVR